MTEFPVVAPVDDEAFEHAKREQARAADPETSSWVEANAGSGKTKVLIDRVARLLLRRPDGRPGAAPDSILCVTYTKAAANEMLSRLYERLGGWSIASDDALRESLSKLEGRAKSDYDQAALRDARALFARSLETPGGLRIETIHAFCARILRRFPLEAGVAPGFREIEEGEAERLWASVLAEYLPKAAQDHEAELIVVSRAAGGFGVAAALDALKYRRQDLLAFSRSLDQGETDLAARVRTALGASDSAPDALIAKAVGDDLPKRRLEPLPAVLEAAKKPTGKDLNLAAALRIVCGAGDPRERWDAYVSVFQTQTGWGAKNPYGASLRGHADLEDLFQVEGDLGSEIARLQETERQLRACEAAERTAALLTIGLPVIRAYQAAKRARAALDFDDLILHTLALLTHSEAAPWVLYKLDGGLSHILLDEAQDTSPPQWALINALVDEFRSGLGQVGDTIKRTQFVVGDPKQSIYSFQGADQQHFEREQTRFVAREEALGDAVSLPEMNMSFRSSPEILTFVDEVRARIPLGSAALDGFPPREANLLPHAPRRTNQPGLVELWPLEMPILAEPDASHWTAPPDHTPENAPRRRLAERIARSVRTMIDRGDTVWRSLQGGRAQRRPVQPQDILILVRRRNDLFDALIDSLKREGLPVAGADRLKLLDNIGVQDCLNLIRLALQPSDDLTLAEILRGPFCGLVDDDLHLYPLAYDRKSGESLWQRLQASTAEAFQPAKTFCQALIATRGLSAFDFLTEHLTVRRGDGLSGWDRLVQRLGEPVRDPVRALLQKALGFDMRSAASLQAFLAEIEADMSELKRDLGEPEGAVRVMTVHGAKGLQSPIVILPDTTSGTRRSDDQIFLTADGTPVYSPSAKLDSDKIKRLREDKSEANERESRRLLYVALTRAQDRLIICGAGLASPASGFAKSSWYRWCLAAMTGLNGGDPDDVPEQVMQFGELPPHLASARPDQGRASAPEYSWLYQLAGQGAAGRRMLAPSALVPDQAPVLAPLQPDREFSLKRGRMIHTLLQTLSERPASDHETAATAILGRNQAFDDAQRAEILKTTLAVLRDAGFAAVFAPGGRNEAAIVGTLPNGLAVNGRVDRLCVTDSEILIFDYKTDRPAPTSAENVGLSYLVQMAAYQAILKQIYGDGRTVRCAILYTDGPKLIPLPDDLLLESLNRVNSEV